MSSRKLAWFGLLPVCCRTRKTSLIISLLWVEVFCNLGHELGDPSGLVLLGKISGLCFERDRAAMFIFVL
jgi:hypothetical protein